MAVLLSCSLSGKGIVNDVNFQKTAEYQAVSVSVMENMGIQTHAKSAYLMDFNTKTVVYSHEESKRLPIASMCKIMTLLLSFEAIENGQFGMEDDICVSERAASMGGSQVFLEANAKYKACELIKSIVVCSANDSCVALAERIAGSESLFVEKMNEKAKELGAENTLFANCTGLPKEPQYSCAKDVALMLKALLQHEGYYQFGKVWLDKFQHPEGRFTEITNTNKLIRFYEGCDGGKTGFTNEAGFCLAATAKRDNMQLIAVVLGAPTSDKRFSSARALLDYGFATYKVKELVKKNENLCSADVINGTEKSVNGVAKENKTVLFEKNNSKDIERRVFVDSDITAPIKKGEVLGYIEFVSDGKVIDKVYIISEKTVDKKGIGQIMKDIMVGFI
jgi:D-alanyl-D-alanine carboxypeptidase (penicillin-binding protein 5/6)